MVRIIPLAKWILNVDNMNCYHQESKLLAIKLTKRNNIKTHKQNYFHQKDWEYELRTDKLEYNT